MSFEGRLGRMRAQDRYQPLPAEHPMIYVGFRETLLTACMTGMRRKRKLYSVQILVIVRISDASVFCPRSEQNLPNMADLSSSGQKREVVFL